MDLVTGTADGVSPMRGRVGDATHLLLLAPIPA